jgi:hypothetical protein
MLVLRLAKLPKGLLPLPPDGVTVTETLANEPSMMGGA